MLRDPSNALASRGSPFIMVGHIYPITHRCHDRQFLLKFAKDRDAYRHRLLEAARPEDGTLPGLCGLKYGSLWGRETSQPMGLDGLWRIDEG